MPPIVLGHLSDLHFSKIDFNPSQLLSKRWLGNLNLIFFRNGKYLPERLRQLPAFAKAQGITHLIITGDLTTTARPIEFERAKQFLDGFTAEGIKLIVLPGNHDTYTRRSDKQKRFYNYFPDLSDSFGYCLKKDRLVSIPLGNNHELVIIDTAVATSLAFSGGHFDQLLAIKLADLLSKTPKSKEIILACHFPLFESVRRSLAGEKRLIEILRASPNVKLYLCGHTHIQKTENLRCDGLPLMSNSGSISYYKNATWNKLTLSPGLAEITSFKLESAAQNPHWITTSTQTLSY